MFTALFWAQVVQQEFLAAFNTPPRVHLYIRNTEAAVKLRYPGHYLVIARTLGALGTFFDHVARRVRVLPA